MLTSVIFELDYVVVVNMIQTILSTNMHIHPLLQEVIYLLQCSNERTSVTHVLRKANLCADWLTNKCHSAQSFEWVVVNYLFPNLSIIISDNVRGVCLLHLIL